MTTRLRLALALCLLAGAAVAAEPTAPAADLAFGAYQRGDYVAARGEAEKRLASNPKDAAALTLIGRLYLDGQGVAPDRAKAMQWFRRAADAGGRDAAYFFGAAALTGRDTLKDHALARAYLEKAQEHPAALELLGEAALENDGTEPDFARAIAYFRRAATLENSDAAYALALLYKNGRGVAADPAEAAKWLRKAAEAGHTAAMVEFAIMEFNGAGVARDRTHAVELLRRAAAAGNVVAQNRLARLLAEGLGVEKNHSEAMLWNSRAKASGLIDDKLDALLAATIPSAEKPATPLPPAAAK
ncbi:sel1 repeat family protein [Methylosinus sp. H3A]|uniref:tetratricopeptide repeat protein n=1 Tax=Methylosinus sp. H3A TaxID=2785786 RepID=UPI0018C2F6C7|nr:tetratricopeptide repeat protein [Methylosinus sp. H3A]MBG0809406.1 sel1 repeat family protein [Methylosinus sp. H3A]